MRYTGVDEVGYGALAGPIVAVAVTMDIPAKYKHLHDFWPISAVRDSKKTTPAQRVKLVPEIVEYLIWHDAEVGISEISAKLINTLGFSEAADRARTVAVEKSTLDAGLRPGLIIVDGTIPLTRSPGRQVVQIKADNKVWLVAAASILAKFYRDALMQRLARKYPMYDWAKNKGYAGGTASSSRHVRGLAEHGLSPFHRKKPCATMLAKLP